MGSRLWLEDKLVIDNWDNQTTSHLSGPVDVDASKPMKIRFEYWQASSSGNPCIALQWSLLSTTSGPNTASSQSIQKAAQLTESAAAAVVVLGGANNDLNSTTEGEGTDRSSLALPGYQLALLRAVVDAANKTGVPVVVVLVDGSPTAEPYIASLSSVIAAFQGGQAGAVQWLKS
jgi:beta-glucosidase